MRYHRIIQEQGLTLIELMVTLALAALLLAIAVPAFDQALQNSRTTAQVNELVANLQVTRSEAVTRGIPATFRTTGADWSSAAEIVADVNEDGDLNDAEDLIQTLDFVSNATLTATDENANAVTAVTFTAAGSLASAVTFVYVADDCSNSNQRIVTIGLSGIVSSSKAACP